MLCAPLVDSESGSVIGVLQAINKHPDQTMLDMRVYSEKRAGTKMFSSFRGKSRSATVIRSGESKKRGDGTRRTTHTRSPSMIRAVLGKRIIEGSKGSGADTIAEGGEEDEDTDSSRGRALVHRHSALKQLHESLNNAGIGQETSNCQSISDHICSADRSKFSKSATHLHIVHTPLMAPGSRLA